ncbi:MAG: integrase [Bradyrhizobium sp.]|uniref:tyrosine-type recombinase/integrase n=1 Tax=Bradyrhizobium sp. TaxID=376 RepID=UPI003C70A9B4
MVVRVKLKGLKITRNKARRYYVYVRGTRRALISNFDGDREALTERLGEIDVMTVYNATRKHELNRVYADGTLGALVNWFKADCPNYAKLSDATRNDYDKAFYWLESGFDCPLDLITTPELYDLRDRCIKEKWPRFADKMISALSSMLTQAVKRRKMPTNPCLGMDKAHKADPNSNREWFGPEWDFVRNNAPTEVLIPCMIARYAGLAGQTIVGLNDKQFLDHPLTGKAVQYTRRKNGKATLLPVLPELQVFLGARDIRRADGLIAIRDDGSPWETEKDMQTRVSHWLRDRERDGKIGAGTTLHGLRVSYASWWKRNGASDEEVARLIGDKSVAMGSHYTRHVEDEVSIARAFNRLGKDGA